jgi:hypothetical protein
LICVPNLSASPDPSSEGRVFNDDILQNAGDLRYAEEQFGEVFPLLDNPGLRRVFLKYEQKANKARRWVQWLGLLAVFFATVALLSAASESFLAHVRHSEALIIIFEACGVVAALIAGGSLWLGPWKKRWLESRFMTERLRQWHFQLLIRRANEIETLLENITPESVQKFHVQRQSWLNDFLHDYEGKLDSRMDSLTHDPDFSNDWLHDCPTKFKENSSILSRLFDAYRRLRFLHQYDYVTYKLSLATDRPFWELLSWPLLRQESFIGGAASFCFVAALLCAFAVITNRLFEIKPALDSLLACLTLVNAIIGIALRTVQDGLGVTEDIERYRDYRGKVRRALLHFETTQDQETKLRLMEEMELASVDELRGFLRTHGESRFVL